MQQKNHNVVMTDGPTAFLATAEFSSLDALVVDSLCFKTSMVMYVVVILESFFFFSGARFFHHFFIGSSCCFSPFFSYHFLSLSDFSSYYYYTQSCTCTTVLHTRTSTITEKPFHSGQYPYYRHLSFVVVVVVARRSSSLRPVFCADLWQRAVVKKGIYFGTKIPSDCKHHEKRKPLSFAVILLTVFHRFLVHRRKRGDPRKASRALYQFSFLPLIVSSCVSQLVFLF